MVDYVFKFRSNQVNLVSWKIFDCRLHNLLAVFFSLSRDVVLAFSEPPRSFLYKATRFLRIQSGRVERVVKVRCSVVNCCGLLL